MAPALLTAQDCAGQVHLIIGSGPLAASRCAKSLEIGAKPIVIAPADSELHYTLAKHVDAGKATWVQRHFEDNDLRSHGREEVEHVVDAVFVTIGAKTPLSTHISTLCRRLRVPVNVADAPNLCTFTILSTHSDGPLQIGITTSGRGCKLSSRIRREVAASLPPKFGEAVERLGTIRRRIWEEDHAAQLAMDPDAEEEESVNQKHTFNNFVDPAAADPEIARNRRMRWLAQICEYWPLHRLAAITDADISAVLSAYTSTTSTTDSAPLTPSTLDARLQRRGIIILAGSGPGHPDLLTRATHTAIQHADFILADKLVPAGVLELIPRRTPVHIARKFPGNADAAQEELLRLGLEALQQGKTVLRLKQGDPYLYGRGAEELAFFREHGFEARVLPGVTSALSAPLFAGIPVTHRAVSDQVLICTGTGRKGAAPDLPPYVASQTVVFLMALHRLESLVNSLTVRPTSEVDDGPQKALWPLRTPCAVIERASCPDQRVIRSTLEYVCKAVEEEGSRPPGLLVLGWSCNVLHKSGGQRWVVEDGFRGLDDIGAEKALDIVKEIGELTVSRKVANGTGATSASLKAA
jgi:uroporphyrin-III C-methyltransferase